MYSDIVAPLILRVPHTQRRSISASSTSISSHTCQYRPPRRHHGARRHASNSSKTRFVQPGPSIPTHSRLSQIPIPSGSRQETFTPQPLNHPLGLAYPPELSHNTGLDPRTFRQRHADFTNYDSHLVRRKQLTSEFMKPYFRDWSMLRHHKGKSFVANDRLFKREKAGWFPNIWGWTLLTNRSNDKRFIPKLGWNTTQVLEGRVSVVAVFSGNWAERQVKSFLEKNETLMEMYNRRTDQLLQIVRINYEDNWLRRFLIYAFRWRLRRQLSKKDQDKYFIVNKSFRSRDLQDAMGFLNTKVGYVYLIDSDCRIRWAGSAYADAKELVSLNAGVKKLLGEREKEVDATSRNVIMANPNQANVSAAIAS